MDTVDGALIAQLTAITVATPLLISKILVPLAAAWIARINAGTSRNIANMDIFKEVQREVDELRTQSLSDKKRIYDLEVQVLKLQGLGSEKDQTILSLQQELADCREKSSPPTVQLVQN